MNQYSSMEAKCVVQINYIQGFFYFSFTIKLLASHIANEHTRFHSVEHP